MLSRLVFWDFLLKYFKFRIPNILQFLVSDLFSLIKRLFGLTKTNNYNKVKRMGNFRRNEYSTQN